MSRKKQPKIIEVSSDQLNSLNARISANTAILEEDKRVVLAILSIYTWLQQQLDRQKLSIKRLKKLFGFTTERRRKRNKKAPKNSPTDSISSSDDSALTNTDQSDGEGSSKKQLSGTH